MYEIVNKIIKTVQHILIIKLITFSLVKVRTEI